MRLPSTSGLRARDASVASSWAPDVSARSAAGLESISQPELAPRLPIGGERLL